MFKIFKSFFICLFFLISSVFFSGKVAAQTDIPPAPTLIAPNQKIATADLRPLIIGLTKDKTKAIIFIDGAQDGETEILSQVSGTANFAYRPKTNLSRGRHEIYAAAREAGGAASAPSPVMNFTIEWPMPAPTMIKAVVNKNTVSSRPFITGLAKNNSRIKVYIDNKYGGEFLVKNHQSGTANFAYKPIAALRRGSHQAYTIAIDKRGKVSIHSNAITFFVKTAAIAQAASERRASAVAGIKEIKARSRRGAASGAEISANTGRVENKKQAPAPTAQGSVNESRESQSKLKLSLVLFILFLIGVVAWLLWVNRELIKERRAQNEAAEKNIEEKKDQ